MMGIGKVETMGEVSSIKVRNESDGPVTYILSMENPIGWEAGDEAGNERYVVRAGFSKEVGGIDFEAVENSLSTVGKECTETRFRGDESGVNVGAGEERTLWLQFRSPIYTSITDEQSIKVKIGAKIP
jgi:hypothetical protein